MKLNPQVDVGYIVGLHLSSQTFSLFILLEQNDLGSKLLIFFVDLMRFKNVLICAKTTNILIFTFW